MIGSREGQQVSYVGDPVNGLSIGDQGRILSEAGGSGAHVIWLTGSRKGLVDLLHDLDIVPSHEASIVDDSLDTPMVGISVRAVYEAEGESGVLNALNAEGALSIPFGQIAREAKSFIAQRLRETPLMRQVIADLETDEAEDLIVMASTVLIRDVLA